MAPEILLQHKSSSVKLTAAMDIWALGCIGLEMAYHKQIPIFESPYHMEHPMRYYIEDDVRFVARAMFLLLGTPEGESGYKQIDHACTYAVQLEFDGLENEAFAELINILRAEGQITQVPFCAECSIDMADSNFLLVSENRAICKLGATYI